MNLLLNLTKPQAPDIVLPALIAEAGERAAWRFLEFFTVNIRNKNTRAAYGQAAGAFLRWCEERGISASRTCSRSMSPPTSRSCRAPSPRPP